MAIYNYQAIAPPKTLRTGTISADSPRTAREILRTRGLRIESIHPDRPSIQRWQRGFSRQTILSFLREMSTLLAVGVPLTEALSHVAKQHKGRFGSLVLNLRDRIESGQSFSEALGAYPHVFDDLFVAVTRAGEDAGALDRSLSRLAQFKERSHQLTSKVATTLIYPSIVLVLAIIIAVFLMTYVVPSILEPLQELGRPLPLPTRIVKWISDGLVVWGWLGALIVTASFFGGSWIMRYPLIRRFVDRMLLRTPLLGDLLRKTLIVRIAVVISTLLGTGVVFLHALKIAAETTRNSVIRDALSRCEAAVSAGSDISTALEATRAFPPVVIQVFAVGEQSGQLSELLDRLATDYDQEVSLVAQRLTAVLEPILIIGLASVVLLIAMATMLPILEVGDAMQ